MLSGEYNGFDRDIGDPLWNLTDLWISTRVGTLGTLKLGKRKRSSTSWRRRPALRPRP